MIRYAARAQEPMKRMKVTHSATRKMKMSHFANTKDENDTSHVARCVSSLYNMYNWLTASRIYADKYYSVSLVSLMEATAHRVQLENVVESILGSSAVSTHTRYKMRSSLEESTTRKPATRRNDHIDRRQRNQDGYVRGEQGSAKRPEAANNCTIIIPHK